MAEEIFLCSSPTPPYACTFVSATSENVVNHLLQSHIGIAQYRRRYGAAALTKLPITATILRQPVMQRQPATPALLIFLCDTCEVYFVHSRAYTEHLNNDAHAQQSAAAIDQMGEYTFEDAMIAEHTRYLVLGAPPPAAAPRHRLMINFTAPYARDPCSVTMHATTIAELKSIIDTAYGQRNHPIDWPRLWNHGLVFRYSSSGDNVSGRMVVQNDEDVARLAQKMDFGECCVGDARRV